jgi:hypothetical protein
MLPSVAIRDEVTLLLDLPCAVDLRQGAVGL